MFARALILLLLVLNLGVATWWALRPEPSAAAVVPALPTAPRLQLLDEARPRTVVPAVVATPAPASTSAPAPAAETAAPPGRCIAFGPFADAAALSRAQALLQPRVTTLRVRRASAGGRGWRVWLPALADREAAQAMAARIVAAGFDDYYVVPNGDEANSIALGRYGNEASAQQRTAALRAAGFPAQAEALGAPVSWIDVDVPAGFDAGAARTQAAAAQARPLDCAKLR
jgi:hypothetical protein